MKDATNAIDSLLARKERDRQIAVNAQGLVRLFQAKLESDNLHLSAKKSRRVKALIITETLKIDQVSAKVSDHVVTDSQKESGEITTTPNSEEVTAETTDTMDMMPGSDFEESKPQVASKQNLEKKPLKTRRRRAMQEKNVEIIATEEDTKERIVISHDTNIYFRKTADIENKFAWLLNETERGKVIKSLPKVAFWGTIRNSLFKFGLMQNGGYMCDEMLRIFPFAGPAGYNGIIISPELKMEVQRMNLPGLHAYFK